MNNPSSKASGHDSKNKKDNNLLYITVFTLLIIAAVVIVLLIKSGSDNSSGSGADNNNDLGTVTAKTISIVSESGAQDAVINSKITNIRKIKFQASRDDVEEYEKSQNDTLDGTYTESTDGYGYLTFTFSTANIASFFNTSVSPSDANALLQYVFYNNKLIEIRVQYGALGETAYDSIVSDITSKYGDATYFRAYSNDNKETWWKSKNVTLTAYYQSNGVSVYFRKNS